MDQQDKLLGKVAIAMAAQSEFALDAIGYDNIVQLARTAIGVSLSEVEAHLSAVQYDPAPYTALKHRLASLTPPENQHG